MDGADPDKRRIETQWLLGDFLPRVDGSGLHTHTDLRRLREGGVDVQWVSIFVHSRYVPEDASQAGRAVQRAVDVIDAVEQQVQRHSGDLVLARGSQEARRAVAEGRIALLLGLEGGHAIEDSLDNLRMLYARGIRYMTLTWSNSNGWADSSGDEPRHGGLTDFGRQVVAEMNRLGMVVDVSHVSDATFFDAIEATRAPVMASHSSARALVDNPRNMSDEMLRAVAANGGVVMVNFGGTFIDPAFHPRWRAALRWIASGGTARPPLARVADHIEHVIEVAGIDHVGLGSDFDGTLFMPEGLEDVSGYPNLTRELLRRGYDEEELRKILGGNALRVLAEVEAVAAASPR
jgi:membrane dipeptidase